MINWVFCLFCDQETINLLIVLIIKITLKLHFDIFSLNVWPLNISFILIIFKIQSLHLAFLSTFTNKLKGKKYVNKKILATNLMFIARTCSL